jgi:hypothetical protein
MPVYITRNQQEYPTEFYRCTANPQGFEFTCIFCANFYKTKSACVSHMKTCCYNEGIEYNDDLEIGWGGTVYDYHRNHAAKSTTIKNYINTNTLSSLSNLTTNQIIENIQTTLIENGFNDNDSYLYTTSFLIYKFFFIVSEEDKSEFCKRCIEQLR